MGLANEVAIIGVGTTRFGENFELSYMDMVREAGFMAMKDAGITPPQIEAAWLGTCYAYAYTTEGNAGTSLAEPLRLYNIPITRVSNYCATGMDAVRNAAMSIAAGEYDVVLVVGVEKMRDVEPRGSLVSQHVEQGHPLYAKGRSAPGMFAMMANRYFDTYGDSKREMGLVSVKNHFNGSLNPNAHFRKPIKLEQALNAQMVAAPLGLFDCCPTTDGAAAMVLTRASLASQFKKDYSIIRGLGMSVTSGYFEAQFRQDWDFLGFPATQKAAEMAYRHAGITNPREEIDVVECHDCFTITEILNYEDLGLCNRGDGRLMAREGETSLEGAMPVNPSGGLKSCGHPIGASGVRMMAEIHHQVLGQAGKKQVKDAKTGLAHTLGGPGAVSCVAVIGRPS